MLRRAISALLATAALSLLGISGAAGAPITCPPGTALVAGRCIIVIEQPGTGTPPPNPGTGGGSSGPATCYYGSTEIPCSVDGAYWNASRGCYTRAVDPQPGPEDEVWEGHTDGLILACLQPSCLGQAGGECYSEHYWAAAAPGAGPSPRELADRAVAAMDFRAPEIGLTGQGADADSMQIIGLPTWMWVSDPDEHTVGPITRSASAGGITVTATGTLDRIVWSMGDGSTVTCDGAAARGTRYDASYGASPSPTCGHWYTRTSAGQPREAYAVTATSYWTVAWAGGGQSGTIPLTFERSTQLPVGELQVLLTAGGG